MSNLEQNIQLNTAKTAEQLQTALYHIAKAALEADNLLDLCRLVHKTIDSLLPAKNIYIALYDAVNDILEFPYYMDEYDGKTRRATGKAKRGMTEYVMRRGEIVLIQQADYEALIASGEIEAIGTPPLQWLGIPLRLSDGRIIGALAVQTYNEGVFYTNQDRDVLAFVSTQIAQTLERKRANQTLRESEEKYRAIVETTYDGVFIHQGECILYANEQLVAFLGKSMGEILSMNPLELFAEKERVRIAEYMNLRLRGEFAPLSYESVVDGKNGYLVPVELNVSKLHFNGQDAILGVVKDISERKRSEQLRDALYRINDAVNICNNLDDMYKLIHHIISDFIDAKNFFIAIYNKSDNTISYPYCIDQCDFMPIPGDSMQGLTGYVIRTGIPLMAPRKVREAMYANGDAIALGTQSVDWLGIPLCTMEQQIIGALVVQSYTEGTVYSQNDKEMLLFVSSHIAMAIERKQAYEQIQYFSYHDALTGLFNRSYFESKMQLFEQENTFVAIIIADIDGLKLINDSLGHATGDQLLKECSRILKESLPAFAIATRIGGDEFAILLTTASAEKAQLFCESVYQKMDSYNKTSSCLRLNMSLGYAIKSDIAKSLWDVFKEADDCMYREKLRRSPSTGDSIFNSLKKLLKVRNFVTQGHGKHMEILAVLLAEEAQFDPQYIDDIRLLADFHDIGKVSLADNILFKPDSLLPSERQQMEKHVENGYRIARSIADLKPIADWILKHHEWWDGNGYPLGLKGDNIPLACRIIAIVYSYDAMTNDRPYRKALSKEVALLEINRCSGSQFDPDLVKKFNKIMKNYQLEQLC